MIELDDRPTVYFDVDNTLILWNKPAENTTIFLDNYGEVAVHEEHVNSLKQHSVRGHHVVVWSQGGAAWAATVVELLNLTEYVTLVISKPRWFYDDLSSDKWLPETDRIFL